MTKTLSRALLVLVSATCLSALADPAPRILYDDVRNTHHPRTTGGSSASSGSSNNNNRSGLGDGTNPGRGSGNNNSGNTGTNNPGGSRR